MTVFNIIAVILCGLFTGGLINLFSDHILGETAGNKGALFLFPILGRLPRNQKISPRYSLIETINVVLYLIAYFVFSFSPQFFMYAVFYSILLVISYIDICRRVIYVGMNLIIGLIGILACFISPLTAWYDRPAGLLAASLPLLIIFIVSHGGMGIGDVELAAAAGFLLGWQPALFGLLIASITSSIIGLAWGCAKGTGLKTTIPFGPFLAFGFVAASVSICFLKI